MSKLWLVLMLFWVGNSQGYVFPQTPYNWMLVNDYEWRTYILVSLYFNSSTYHTICFLGIFWLLSYSKSANCCSTFSEHKVLFFFSIEAEWLTMIFKFFWNKKLIQKIKIRIYFKNLLIPQNSPGCTQHNHKQPL